MRRTTAPCCDTVLEDFDASENRRMRVIEENSQRMGIQIREIVDRQFLERGDQSLGLAERFDRITIRFELRFAGKRASEQGPKSRDTGE